MVSKLYLHVGHGKTGSSYIQSCLAKSKLLLDKNKICYPINEEERLSAADGNISSGNGYILLQNNFYDVIKEFIHSNHEALLFSNESLMSYILHNTQNIQKKIHELVDLMRVEEINVLLMIRNPMEMASSFYQQQVKRSNWHLDMDAYIDEYVAHFARVLDFIRLIIQWENVSLTIQNYSYIKYHIITEIEKWLILEENTLIHPQISVVNRSLTKGEIVLQRYLNKTLGECATLISDSLCEQLPNIQSEMLELSLEGKKIFVTKMNPIMTEINAMTPTHHGLSMQDTEDLSEDNNEQFIFTNDQVRVIGESFARYIAKQREEICILREILTNSFLLRVSQKLNNLPRIKKLLKILLS